MTIEELENLYPDSCDTEAEYRVFRWITDNYQLINKPVETTNEQLNDNLDLKNKIMNLISEHMKLRNEDGVKDINLYHKFLDWEKELVKLIV